VDHVSSRVCAYRISETSSLPLFSCSEMKSMNSEKGCCSSHGLTKTRLPSLFLVGESALLLLLACSPRMLKRLVTIPVRGYCNLNLLSLQ
jgi:hypothetical protein